MIENKIKLLLEYAETMVSKIEYPITKEFKNKIISIKNNEILHAKIKELRNGKAKIEKDIKGIYFVCDESEDDMILYIGKAEAKNGLNGRIKDYIKTIDNIVKNGNQQENKKLGNHRGGKKILEKVQNEKNIKAKQSKIDEWEFYWIPFEINGLNAASILESLLIICYQFSHGGKYPFANGRN